MVEVPPRMGALVVIGNFDGVHRGHRALLEHAERTAAEKRLEPKLLTFFPHPASVLGRAAPPLLTAQARKRELVREVAPSIAFVEQRFDLAFAAQSPEAFADRLAHDHGAREVVVGKNFRFGKGRAGGFDDLVKLGERFGFVASAEPIHGDERGGGSSTRVRDAIARADLADAEATLGRPHMIAGVVIHGKKLGRTIGFPTCNLDEVAEMLPPIGIYAAIADEVTADGGAHRIGAAALSIGRNPTTDATSDVKVEAHLLDVHRDLYGATLRLHVVERLRGEEKFPSLEALKEQIALDVAATRRIVDERR